MDERALLDHLAGFPLLEAMFGRRSRRFGVGMTIPDGPLAYASAHPPLPLSDLERTVLVLCGAGVSGWHFGMEHTANGDPNAGCNYPVRLTGRVAPTTAGIGTPELIVSDDAGTFITRFRDLDPRRLRELQSAADLQELVGRVADNCVRLAAGRVALPAVDPHIEAHNRWNVNRPGTTLFIPVVDLTQQMLDFLAMLLGAGAILYDTARGRPCGNLEPFVRAGLLDEQQRAPLVDFEQSVVTTGAIELGLICQNIVLALQAMGLGGWMFTGINAPSLLGAFAADGVPGLGFRFTRDPAWTQPNPVGLDGVFEGLCPPFVPDMRAAVERFVALQFGPDGTYDPARPGPFRDNAGVKARIERHSPAMIDMLGEVASYIHDTYGKFPATIPSVYARVYAQAHHLDREYYDTFYGPEAYLETHRRHDATWHG
jgi:hypothetical protein